MFYTATFPKIAPVLTSKLRSSSLINHPPSVQHPSELGMPTSTWLATSDTVYTRFLQYSVFEITVGLYEFRQIFSAEEC